MATRRDFMIGAAAATLPRLVTTGIGGPTAAAESPPPREKDWDQGGVQHLIPTASHASAAFHQPAAEATCGVNRRRNALPA